MTAPPPARPVAPRVAHRVGDEPDERQRDDGEGGGTGDDRPQGRFSVTATTIGSRPKPSIAMTKTYAMVRVTTTARARRIWLRRGPARRWGTAVTGPGVNGAGVTTSRRRLGGHVSLRNRCTIRGS